MIDTLTLGISDFELTDKSNFHLVSDTNLSSGETQERFYYNTDTYNITIDKGGLKLQFSLPKLYGLKDNFYPVGLNSFEVAMNHLERSLDNIGLVADLDNAKILRLDLFKNVEVSQSFYAYSDILRVLGLKRTYNRAYPDGFLSGNTLREVCFYNKVKELTESLGSNYVRQVYNFSGENIVRGELRFLRHMEAKKNGLDLLKDLPNQWSNLKITYSNYMSEVFKYEGGDSLNSETLEPEVLRALVFEALFYLELNGKKAFKRYGFYPFCFIPNQELKRILNEKYTRKQVYNILSQIEKERKEVVFNVSEYRQLYQELKEKFLNN
jgi:hypothetical protein